MEINQYFLIEVEATNRSPLLQYQQNTRFESLPVQITSFVATVRYLFYLPLSMNMFLDSFQQILSREYMMIYLLDTQESYFQSKEKVISWIFRYFVLLEDYYFQGTLNELIGSPLSRSYRFIFPPMSQYAKYRPEILVLKFMMDFSSFMVYGYRKMYIQALGGKGVPNPYSFILACRCEQIWIL